MFLVEFLTKKNSSKTWLYGYNEKYDLVVISKSGQIGRYNIYKRIS